MTDTEFALDTSRPPRRADLRHPEGRLLRLGWLAVAMGVSALALGIALVMRPQPALLLPASASLPIEAEPSVAEEREPTACGPLWTAHVSLQGPLVSIERASSTAGDRPAPRRTSLPRGESVPPAQALQDQGGQRVSDLTSVSVGRKHPGHIAVWSERVVAISWDHGNDFRVVYRVDSPGAHTQDGARAPSEDSWRIGAVAWDRRGIAFIARTSGERAEVGQLARTGDITWRPLPLAASLSEFEAAAGHLVWLGQAERDGDHRDVVAISGDRGKSWQVRPVETGNFSLDMMVDDNGRIQVMWGSEAGCGGGHQERAFGQVERTGWTPGSWPLDVPVGWLIGAHGYAYAVTDDCVDSDRDSSAMVLCAIGPGGEDAPVRAASRELSAALAEHTPMLASNGDESLVLLGSHILRVRRAKAEILSTDTDTPDGIESLALDRWERLYAVRRGQLLRWTEASGWRALFPSTAALAVTGR